MSYQARIDIPLLIVTGCTGACGKTNRIGSAGRSSSPHDRHEVAAVGAEAVQPDDAPLRVAAGLELDRVEELGHHRFGRSADFGRKALTTASWVSMYGPPMRSMQ